MLNFTIEIVPSATYYKDYYREWASQKWLRRNESYLGVAMICFWAGLRYIDSNNALGAVPYFFIAVGVYETVKPFYTKYKWLKYRASSRLNGQKIFAHFGDESINVNGPFSSGVLKWAGIKEIKQTPNALFIIPENGISIFLPKSAFDSAEQIRAIINKQAAPKH